MFYYLKDKKSGKLVGYDTTHTDSDFSVDTIHELSIYSNIYFYLKAFYGFFIKIKSNFVFDE